MSVVNEVYIAAFLGTKITHCILPVKEAAANQSHILWKIFHQNFIGCDIRQREVRTQVVIYLT